MQNTAVQILKQDGRRITKARRGIREILASASKPMTPSEILRAAITRGIGMDKVTVYRELGFLVEQGIAVEIRFHDRAKRYELASTGHHHHLVCEKCDRIEDVDVKDNFGAQAKLIERRTKFKILRHSLEFFGLCARCS